MLKKLLAKIPRRPTVAVLRLHGVIGTTGRGGATLNDTNLSDLIERAFQKGKPKAVALSINSPGGSPVQSSLIAARIRRLAQEKNLPIYAFCEDVAASGGYWLASAADQIYVDENSIIGSIGVISAGFGFHGLLEKHGVERRVHTAGVNKSLSDPFLPEKPADVKRLKALQKAIHDNFITQVKSRRGDRLAKRDLFTGEIWVGQSAIEVGLADHIGHLVPVMKGIYGDKTRFILHCKKHGFLSRFSTSITQHIFDSLEHRSLWARFGL